MASQKTVKEKSFALLRITFGFVWAIDAWFKWQPSFLNGAGNYLTDAMMGQPPAVQAWINFWIGITSVNPHFYAILIACIETAIAIMLIFGFLTDIAITLGIIFSLILWSVAEGFGGPYGPGSTDIGTAIMYVFIFWALWIGAGSSAWSVDAWLQKKYPTFFLSKKSRQGEQKSIRAVLLKSGLGAIVVLAVLFFAAPASYSPTSQSMMASADPNMAGLGVMPGMILKEFAVNPATAIPTVDFTVTKDPVGGGWNLHIITTNFIFTPENENQLPIANEGHAHLYIDGTLFVVYGPWYHFDDLSPGDHTIVVTLNANDHSVFAVNGMYIKKLENIVQN